MEKYFPQDKIVFTGNPVRQDVVMISGKREEALLYFGLAPEKKTLLVIGGSLGAGTINQAVLKFVNEAQADLNIQLLWQTGKHYYEKIMASFAEPDPPFPGPKSVIQNLKSKIQHPVILPFIDRMDLAYAAADFIISRAGAIAISELCMVGKPVILVPSPNVAEDHQTKNARALERKKAAILIPDSEAVNRLGTTIHELLGNVKQQSDLKRNIAALGISGAAEKIAAIALSLAEPDQIPQKQVSGLRDLKSAYFLGIGGIGMSALARYFLSQGISVSGYDKTPTALTDQLTGEGMQIHFTEDISLLPVNPGLVIYTPAIPADHLEFRYLKEHNYPLKKRAEVLGMISGIYQTIAVAGTHGKTTTSTMIAHILKSAGVDMKGFLGGIPKNYGTNYLSGSKDPAVKEPVHGKAAGPFCVVEADEYDRSFLHLSPSIAIITSADADHLDIYGNHNDMKNSFAEFTSKIVAGGSLVMKAGTRIAPVNTNEYAIYSYALTADADFYATNIRIVEGLFHFDFVNPAGTIQGIILGVPGKFNLENAIAALAAGCLLGIGEDQLRQALLTYQGVQRRFEFKVRRPDFVYIDDYAHHPEEIRACIAAVRELFPGKKITAVFQPHLFSRTRDFADDFARSLEQLDDLILLEIYPAREKPIEGITSQMLLDRVKLGHKRLVHKNDLLGQIRASEPEILLTLGAGDIDQFVAPIAELFSEPIT
jgi:UDP-N-acetylmuramate--alanine ligase